MGLSLLGRVANKGKLIFAKQIEAQAQAELEGMSRRAGSDFVTEAQIYPPENEGNRSPHPYWQRGTGLVHSGGRVSPVSQNLGQNWTVSGFKTPFGGTAKVNNPTTYLPWVHDEQLQAGFHKSRGWRTITAIAAAVGIKVERRAQGKYTAIQADGYLQQSANKIRTFIQSIFNK